MGDHNMGDGLRRKLLAHRDETDKVVKEEACYPEEVVTVEAEPEWENLWATQWNISPMFRSGTPLEKTIEDLKCKRVDPMTVLVARCSVWLVIIPSSHGCTGGFRCPWLYH